MARYIVGFNTPGYLPDSEAAEHENYDDALDDYNAEIERFTDDGYRVGTQCIGMGATPERNCSVYYDGILEYELWLEWAGDDE